MSDAPEPEDCLTMAQVRAGVDEVDEAIVSLITMRFGYMDAAARIKSDRTEVRDDARKADVLAKVDEAADEAEIDRELIARIYEDLIETSIAHELGRWDFIRAG